MKGTKNIQAPGGRKSWLVLSLLLIAVVAFIILARTQSRVKEEVTIEFSPYPGEAMGAVAVALYYDSPDIDYLKMGEILGRAAQQGIPVTLFFTPRGETDIATLLSEEPRLDFDIGEVLRVINASGARAEIGTGGYADIPYPTLTYRQQEELMRLAKQAWKKEGISVTAFLPPSLQVTYDTILAAENNKMKDVIIPGENSSSPLHPKAVVGGLMNVILLPYSKEGTDQGVNIVFISLSGDDYSEVDKALFDLRNDRSVWKATVSEIDERVRDAEAIGATLVTDPSKASSILTFNGAKDGSKAVFRTVLGVKGILMGNETREFHRIEGGFYILLNSSDRQASIEWDIED